MEESAHVGSLIACIQSLQSSLAQRGPGGASHGSRVRLDRGWLGALAASIEHAMFFEADFGERWAGEALHWLLESGNRLYVVLSHWVRAGTHTSRRVGFWTGLITLTWVWELGKLLCWLSSFARRWAPFALRCSRRPAWVLWLWQVSVLVVWQHMACGHFAGAGRW